MRKAGTLICWLLLTIIVTALGQEGRQYSLNQSQVLTRPVVDDDLTYVTTVQAFSKALQKTKTAGGIVRLSECQEKAVMQKWQPLGGSLQEVLNEIVRVDPQYRWTIEAEVVNVLPAEDEPAFLKTHISSFSAKKIASPDAAVSKLLVLPEVQASLRKQGLNEALKVVATPMAVGQEEVAHKVRCQDVTLREALNAIARSFGNAVWAYKEKRCGGKDEFSLDFIVQ
jgi:hypothetical protein